MFNLEKKNIYNYFILHTLFTYNNKHTVSPLFLLVGQISVPYFENGGSEKKECLGVLKRVPARYICLGGLVYF